MKILKKIMIGFIAFVILFLVVAFFLPSDVRVERSIVINAADSVVFSYLINLKYRSDWDPWLEMEPSAKVSLSETTVGVKAGYAWEGDEIGSGEMTIVEIEKNSSIRSKIVFISPRTGEGDVYWNLSKTENGTKLSWTFESEMSYPLERYIGLLMDSMLDESLEKGLSNIDREIEESMVEKNTTTDKNE